MISKHVLERSSHFNKANILLYLCFSLWCVLFVCKIQNITYYSNISGPLCQNSVNLWHTNCIRKC